MVNWKDVEYVRPIAWATPFGLMAGSDGENLNRRPNIILPQQWWVKHEAVLPPDLQMCTATRMGPAQWFGLGMARPAGDLPDDVTGNLAWPHTQT